MEEDNDESKTGQDTHSSAAGGNVGGFSIVGGLFLPRDRARPEVTPLRVGARVPEDWKLDSWPSESMLFVVPTGGGLSGSATARLASMPESSPKKPPPGAPDLCAQGACIAGREGS